MGSKWQQTGLLARLTRSKAPAVAVASLPTAADPLRVRLGDCELLFERGRWQAEGGGAAPRGSRALARENAELRAELRKARFQNALLVELLVRSRLDCEEYGRIVESMDKGGAGGHGGGNGDGEDDNEDEDENEEDEDEEGDEEDAAAS